MKHAQPAPADIAGLTVLVRAVLDCSNKDGLAGLLSGLADCNARVVVMSAIGAPGGEFNPTLSLKRFVSPLAQATGKSVHFVPDCVGAVAEIGVGMAPFGDLVLLENLAFHKGETSGDRTFAIRLSVLGDIYLDATEDMLDDVSASVSVLPSLMPGLAGVPVSRQPQKEV
ncbi:phosphoglycerate kinase [Chelativorans salis]|uniref:phosphoglycerate kinase n=1 Tax=Chelativorans salis TaxID=2978478 RepID=A0ABT2LIJ5_9HYPH|nr:phosphoglycerate kinase [Chelativorans sp. EGI FJ00035]MCT7374303.1 phosphoglycerate kinase [Chelativorans sp. EGI FJ00035]